MTNHKPTIGIIGMNREPYPLPEGIINGGLKICGTITDNISKDNFNVIFFSASESKTKKRLESFNIESYYKFSNKKILTTKQYAEIDKKIILQREQDLFIKALKSLDKKSIDLLHVHNQFFNIASLLQLTTKPIVFTSHDPLTGYHAHFLKNLNNFSLIAVSKNQNEQAKKNGLKVKKIIYNGISQKEFSYSEDKSTQDLLFVGRIVETKGIREAIETAKKLKKRLSIVGQFDMIINDPKITNYLKTNLQEFPELFQYFNSLTQKEILRKYQEAKILLFPSIHREEPFGLTIIEAMSTGTPTIAFAGGAIPEIIKDGETGFIVNPSDDDIRGDWIIKKTGIEGLCEAVKRIYNMPNDQYVQMRKNCRAHVEKNFTIERMVDEYEKVYQEILNK